MFDKTGLENQSLNLRVDLTGLDGGNLGDKGGRLGPQSVVALPVLRHPATEVDCFADIDNTTSGVFVNIDARSGGDLSQIRDHGYILAQNFDTI